MSNVTGCDVECAQVSGAFSEGKATSYRHFLCNNRVYLKLRRIFLIRVFSSINTTIHILPPPFTQERHVTGDGVNYYSIDKNIKT